MRAGGKPQRYVRIEEHDELKNGVKMLQVIIANDSIERERLEDIVAAQKKTNGVLLKENAQLHDIIAKAQPIVWQWEHRVKHGKTPIADSMK